MQAQAVVVSPIARAGFALAHDAQLLTVPEGREVQAVDTFGALYEPQPVLHEDCGDTAWLQVVRQALESASYAELHAIAMLEHEVAGIAADRLLPELLKAYEQQKELQQQQEVDSAERERQQARVKTRVRTAMARAHKDAADAHQLLAIAPQAGKERAQFLKMALAMQPTAREAAVRLAKLYGRLREDARAAEARELQRVVLPVGVALGDDVLGMLPGETVLMDDPDLQFLWVSRFVDHSLMVYERQSIVRRRLARGDAVVLVDESGSMSGESLQLAKAFALAVKATVESDGRRRCHLASFSTEVRAAGDVLQWAQQQLGGGTSFDKALEYVLGHLAQQSHADAVIVTDGEDAVDEAIAQEVLQQKQRLGWRLFVVYVGHAPRSLEHLADSEVALSADALHILTGGTANGMGL